MATPSLEQLSPALIERSKTLVNNDLKRMLKEEGMPTSGVKAVLLGRVQDLISRAVDNNDHTLFTRLQHRISHQGAAPSSHSFSLSEILNAGIAPVNNRGMSNGHTIAGFQQPNRAAQGDAHFKESPFYEVRQCVLQGLTLEVSPTHRQTLSRSLVLDDAICARLKQEPSLRLFLFSMLEQPLGPFTRADISFPSQIEVRVNTEEVKANFKGLKNKQGTTRPADITSLVRISPANYRNTLQITYALTQKKYKVFVIMVKKHSVEDLAKRIGERNAITKQQVLNEMQKKASDPDIVVESSVMSLKDPVSTLKMTIPCRSMSCTHNRCFDAECFLQLQEQAPTWTCPICHKPISFEGLAVDEYVQEILTKVSKNTDQVTIHPDGQWSTDTAAAASNKNGYHDDDSEEELVVVSGGYRPTIKNESVATPQSLAPTPPLPSREASSAPRTGTKRSSAVIDLTLSDDDDEPVRPVKKVAYSTPNSLPDASSHRYQLHSYATPSARDPRDPMRTPAQPHHSMSSSGPRMDPPNRNTYNNYQPPPPRSLYPGQGSPTYPTYIGSSP